MFEIITALLLAQQPYNRPIMRLRPQQQRSMQQLARNNRPFSSNPNSAPNPSIAEFTAVAGFSPDCDDLDNNQ